MRRAGSTFVPALVALAVGSLLLLFAELQSLRLIAALILLLGVALAVFAVATPEFLSGDLDDD
jgi:hypothetical protein